MNQLDYYNDMFLGNHLAPYATPEAEALAEYARMSEIERIRDTQERFIYTINKHQRNIQLIEDGKRAYLGDSWPIDAKRARQAKKLPVTDINQFRPVVETIVGAERQTRRSIRLLPVERDDDHSAGILNLYLQHVARYNRDSFYETDVMFRIGLVSTRYHREYFWDYASDPLGELKCIYRDPDGVFIDPDATDYNTLSGDARYRFHVEWLTPKALRERYPDKDIAWNRVEYNLGKRSERISQHQTQNIDDKYDFPSLNQSAMFWKDHNYVRLIRQWRYGVKKVFRLVDLSANDPTRVIIGEFDTKKQVEIAKVQMVLAGIPIRGMMTQEAWAKKCEYHVISGNFELEYENDIGSVWPWNDFFAIKLMGQDSSIWDLVKDAQIWTNAFYSKLLDRIGKIGHQPMFIEEGITRDNIDVSAMLNDGQPVVLKQNTLSRGMKPFHIEQDNSLQSIAPLLGLVQNMSQVIRDESGANNIQQGNAPGSVSAASAIAILQQEGQKVISGYSANMSMTRSLDMQLRLALLYKAYRENPELTKYKIERIIGRELTTTSDTQLQAFIINQQIEGGLDLDKILGSLAFARYDVIEDSDLNNMITRSQMLQELNVFRNFGGMVPPEEILETLQTIPAHMKERLRGGVRRMEQAKAQVLGGTPDMANVMSQMGGGEDMTGMLNNNVGSSNRQNEAMRNPLAGVMQ